MYCKPTIFFFEMHVWRDSRDQSQNRFSTSSQTTQSGQDIEDLMLYVKIKSSFVSKLGIREDLFKLTPTSSAPFEPKTKDQKKKRKEERENLLKNRIEQYRFVFKSRNGCFQQMLQNVLHFWIIHFQWFPKHRKNCECCPVSQLIVR